MLTKVKGVRYDTVKKIKSTKFTLNVNYMFAENLQWFVHYV